LASAPLSIDSVIERYKRWNGKYEEAKAELSTAEELESLIEPLIEDLKKKQPKSKEALGKTKVAEPKESLESPEGPSKRSRTAAKEKKARRGGQKQRGAPQD
jgi:hypothetical protein